jgi:hypothetical protein
MQQDEAIHIRCLYDKMRIWSSIVKEAVGHIWDHTCVPFGGIDYAASHRGVQRHKPGKLTSQQGPNALLCTHLPLPSRAQRQQPRARYTVLLDHALLRSCGSACGKTCNKTSPAWRLRHNSGSKKTERSILEVLKSAVKFSLKSCPAIELNLIVSKSIFRPVPLLEVLGRAYSCLTTIYMCRRRKSPH